MCFSLNFYYEIYYYCYNEIIDSIIIVINDEI